MGGGTCALLGSEKVGDDGSGRMEVREVTEGIDAADGVDDGSVSEAWRRVCGD